MLADTLMELGTDASTEGSEAISLDTPHRNE
jgi:hypothetical protein